MSDANILEMLTDSLKDLSPSELRVLQGFAAEQRIVNADRGGLVNFYSAVYCLMENEKYRRKTAFKQQKNEIFGEVKAKWTEDSEQKDE